MSSAQLLTASEIGRRARDGRWLLRRVSLKIAAGEQLAVAGPTGSGKTLLLRALALLDPVDEGRITWNGREIDNASIPEFRRRFVYLHQRPVLLEGSVEENLRLPYTFHSSTGTTYNREGILGRLSLLGRDASFLDKQTGDLSGGEAQILALLRAVQLNPAVLLLDEPTAALDDEAAQTIEKLVGHWLREADHHRATVWVSHHAAQVSRVADRIVRLEAGSVRE